MAVLNVTPDSFSDGGRFLDPARAIDRAHELLAAGADILDIGGESTRPGSDPVPAAEELDRVLPVIEALAQQPGLLLSIDTAKAAVARAALAAGAHIVNDVTGLAGDPAMLSVVRDTGAGLVVMHMKGTPKTMQADPQYGDVVGEVGGFLAGQVRAAVSQGIPAEGMVVDPGIGFGKRLEHNLALLRGLPELARATGRPVLVGVSRKRWIGEITGRDVADRLAGSLAAMAFAIARGARIIRVHDAKESCDVARMIDTLRNTEGDRCR